MPIVQQFESVRWIDGKEVKFSGWECSGNGVIVWDEDKGVAVAKWHAEQQRIERDLEEAWQHLTSRKRTATK